MPARGQEQRVDYASATPGYFPAMGVPVRGGRTFVDADRADAPRVAVINETLARRLWPGESPIGKRLSMMLESLRYFRDRAPEFDPALGMREVVGVVADARRNGFSDAAPAEIYVPFAQRPVRDLTVVIGAHGDPADLTSAVRQAVASLDQGPRTGTALARSACRVIALDDRQLRVALGRYPEFSLMLLSVMVNRVRESIGRVATSESSAARTKWMQPAPLRKDLIEDLARVLGPEAHIGYQTGDTILREGQVGVLMYVVLKGKVAIRAGGKVIENVGPGGIFGEMALVDRTPRLASAMAESNVKLLAVNRAAFLNLVKHSRRFAASLLSAVSARARYAALR
jgi:CRP-like cAMP-binding protein